MYLQYGAYALTNFKVMGRSFVEIPDYDKSMSHEQM
jgi:hypothetical protein